MRFSVSILAFASCLVCEAAIRFTEATWRPDLGFSVPCLEGAVGRPLDLPRAEAYLVTCDGKSSLEDRYDSFDLWSCRTMRGRWRDSFGNELSIARLATVPPDNVPGTVRTRRSFRQALEGFAVGPKQLDRRDEAAAAISPVELLRAVRPRRSQRGNLLDVICYQTSNERALVYAFRPRSPEPRETTSWFLVTLVAAATENMAEVRARFDDEFLDQITVPSLKARRSLAPRSPEPDADADESELLRADVRSQVVNYDEWNCTEAGDVMVIDDLDAGVRRDVVGQLTNNLPRLRREYAKTVPSPLESTNTVALVRVFRNREEYLAYVGVDWEWTEAVWSATHRELVLYHPEAGTEKLLGTLWHEAFHQYLAYAGAMLESSPWFNEGHAELFKNSRFNAKKKFSLIRDPVAAAYVKEYAADLAESLPALLEMDYQQFYAGTQEEVAARYRVAWSVAYFLSVGAPKLRFRPYAGLRADYMTTLVESRSAVEANSRLFGDKKSRDEFVAAWLAFWRRE